MSSKFEGQTMASNNASEEGWVELRQLKYGYTNSIGQKQLFFELQTKISERRKNFIVAKYHKNYIHGTIR